MCLVAYESKYLVILELTAFFTNLNQFQKLKQKGYTWANIGQT